MRRALATALILSGVRTVGAEPCAPRAELGGDGVAVERVAEELRRLGVTVASRPNATLEEGPAATRDGCLIVRAQVALEDGGGIAVAVRGAARGSEGRVVSDAALAAAWIDSWTRDDVDVALWGAPPARVASIEPPPVMPRDTQQQAPATPSRWERFAIALDYEQAWTSDDATWRGLGIAACARVGGFCIGGRARMAFDSERLYNSTGVARDDYSLLAIASYPVALGTMSIAPEVGLGLGRMTTRRAEPDCTVKMPMNCDPMDPNCIEMPPVCEPTTDPGTMTAPKILVGDDFSATTVTPRVALALRIAVPLFQHVWLDGLAGLTFAPLGHDGEYATPMDPVMGTTSLPGEPSSGYMVGVGLRVGAK